jgi:hypothetical protein
MFMIAWYLSGTCGDAIEHVAAQAMAWCQERMIEVVGRIALHADALHHSA